MHRFPHRSGTRRRGKLRSKLGVATVFVALIAAVPACSDDSKVHPGLRSSGGTVAATTEALPCDASGPLGGAICAAREAERVVAEAAERNRNRSSWDRFTEKIERGFGRMGAAINPAIIAGSAVVALGIWLLINASGRVPALAPGRSETGPAAGLRAVAVGRKAVAAGWTIIAGAVVTAGAIGHPGAVFLTMVGSVLVGWGLVSRRRTLIDAAAGFARAEADYLGQVADEAGRVAAEWDRLLAADPDAQRGLDVAVPRPEPRHIPEPSMSMTEAVVAYRTGGLGIAQGSATAALLDGRGRPGPAVKLWHAACETAKVGTADENGNFTPAASVDRVVPLDGGDAILVVIPASAAVGEQQLRSVTGPLLRTAGIRSAGTWEWDGSAFSIRMSNSAAPAAPASPAAGPKPTPTNDDWA